MITDEMVFGAIILIGVCSTIAIQIIGVSIYTYLTKTNQLKEEQK